MTVLGLCFYSETSHYKETNNGAGAVPGLSWNLQKTQGAILLSARTFQHGSPFIIPALQLAGSLWAYPITAKAGSSCRSKGKSIRKLVLNKAVMVTVSGEKEMGRITKRKKKDVTEIEMCTAKNRSPRQRKVKGKDEISGHTPKA